MTEKSLEAHFIKCLKEGNTKKALYIINLLGDKVNTLYGAKSLLHLAKEFDNAEVIQALEQKGVEDILDKEKARKLGKDFIQEMFDGNFEKIDEYIAKGADFNVTYITTPLIYAIEQRKLDIVEKLIKAGADVSKPYDDSFILGIVTPLSMAVKKSCRDIFEILLDAGAKVKGDKSVLTEALDDNQFDIIDELLKRGASLDDVLELRAYNARQANYLLKKGFNPNYETVQRAITDRFPKVALVYLDNYDIANIDVVDDKGKTLLMYALDTRQDEVAVKLIDMGANVNFDDKNTALLFGAYQGCFEVVKKLIEKGEDINQVNEYNQTPLYLAVLNAKSSQVVEYLLQHGADAQIARDDGTTPLVCAVKHEESKMVEVILNNTEGLPRDFIMALHMSRDNSEERKMLMKHLEKVTQNNTAERDRVMSEIIKDRY